jgi:hypothetical protein
MLAWFNVVARLENLKNYYLIYKNFEKMGFNSFEEFMECCKHVHVVTFDRNKLAQLIYLPLLYEKISHFCGCCKLKIIFKTNPV